MTRYIVAGFFVALSTPFVAFAGTQTYSTPGTYSFTVPSYGTLTVQVWGAGGGGASTMVNGSSGSNSQVTGGAASLVAYGGKNGLCGGFECGQSPNGGAGGAASGGDTNSAGSSGANLSGITGGAGGASPNGGAGGSGGYIGTPGSAGTSPGGGGGGAGVTYGMIGGGGGGGGGYADKNFPAGTIAVGNTLTVVVAAGGPGGEDRTPYNEGFRKGGSGAPGRVTITWTAGAPPANPSCSVTFDQNPVPSGSGTIIHWTSSSADWFYINSIGYVSGSGSVQVQPSQTTNYNGSVGRDQDGQTAACPATLIVNASQCVPAYTCVGNSVRNSCTGETILCPTGQSCVNGQCVYTCPAGQHTVGQACICNDTNLPPDTNGQCTTPVCPAGYQYDFVTRRCVEIDQCTLPVTCLDRTHILDQCTGETTDCVATRGEGSYCQSGSCRPPPPPIASITAVPSLVRLRGTTNVAWTSSNTRSCRVTGTNGDGGQINPWTGRSGSQRSAPIRAQVVYTLSCIGLDGSSITKTVKVNIIPNWNEQ